jgi:hypothetical protein
MVLKVVATLNKSSKLWFWKSWFKTGFGHYFKWF